MRRLILSDIHGNLEALEAVMRDAQGLYDEVACCGDIVGYGASPREVIRWARTALTSVIRGNHDRAVWEPGVLDSFTPSARIAVAWCAQVLSAGDREWLRGLRAGPFWGDGFGLVHGSPDDEDAYLEYNMDVRGVDRLLRRSPCFLGHTHIQGGWKWHSGRMQQMPIPLPGEPERVVTLVADVLYLINPGSVGQPRDHDPRAAYAIWDDTGRLLTYRRVEYDIESAQRRIVDAGLPQSLATRLAVGR